MASKQVNPNIGMIKCQCCGRLAAVRKSKASKYYYDCLHCGRITPNLPAGQNLILEQAVIWGEHGTPPDDCPEWIAGNWPWNKALREGQVPPQVPAEKPAPEQPAAQASPAEQRAPVKRQRPRMPPPPPKPEPVKQEQQQQQPRKTGFGFLEGW